MLGGGRIKKNALLNSIVYGFRDQVSLLRLAHNESEEWDTADNKFLLEKINRGKNHKIKDF